MFVIIFMLIEHVTVMVMLVFSVELLEQDRTTVVIDKVVCQNLDKTLRIL